MAGYKDYEGEDAPVAAAIRASARIDLDAINSGEVESASAATIPDDATRTEFCSTHCAEAADTQHGDGEPADCGCGHESCTEEEAVPTSKIIQQKGG
jgi:hypothetical protein